MESILIEAPSRRRRLVGTNLNGNFCNRFAEKIIYEEKGAEESDETRITHIKSNMRIRSRIVPHCNKLSYRERMRVAAGRGPTRLIVAWWRSVEIAVLIVKCIRWISRNVAV
jgi:hypothetical protein